MRVTGNSITNSLLSQLNALAARQSQLQNQAATGQRIQVPEDDPVGMSHALSLMAQNSQTGQYAQNISTLQNRASVAASALQALKQVSDRAGEIATQSDSMSSPQDLQARAVELRQLIQQAAQLANTQDGDQYVFAGSRSDQPAFTLTTDSDGNVTAVTYQGNTSVPEHEIAQGATLTVDAPGANDSGTGPRGVFSDSRYGADFFNHLIALQNHLLARDTNAIQTQDRAALGQDEDNLIYQTASNGVVVSRLETAATAASDQQTALQQSLNNVAGADLATALVQLNQTQNAYQLAVQSSAKFMQLQQTLLSYLP
jgi:flagellar hook-associated protein 3 FlgL